MTGVHRLGMRQPDDRAHADLDCDTLAQVHAEVAEAMTSGEIPQFGTAAWLDLPRGDPARLHATIRAAMSWWSDRVFGNGVPADVLERELRRRLKEASDAVSEAHDWTKQSMRPTHLELVRRRETRPPGGDAA